MACATTVVVGHGPGLASAVVVGVEVGVQVGVAVGVVVGVAGSVELAVGVADVEALVAAEVGEGERLLLGLAVAIEVGVLVGVNVGAVLVGVAGVVAGVALAEPVVGVDTFGAWLAFGLAVGVAALAPMGGDAIAWTSRLRTISERQRFLRPLAPARTVPNDLSIWRKAVWPFEHMHSADFRKNP